LEQARFANAENSEALIDNWSLKIGRRQLKLPMANFQFSILNCPHGRASGRAESRVGLEHPGPADADPSKIRVRGV
jgi:hypothetical protein